MTLYTMEPVRETLHGTFSRDYPAVLEIAPGDTVRYRTIDSGWGLESPAADGAPLRTFSPRDKERDRGYALCGPVAIRGARPGMVLGVRIDGVVPGEYGLTYAGGWDTVVNRRLGMVDVPGHCLRWTLDAAAMTGRNHHGHIITLRPFMGVMGLPPDEPGLHSTAPPRFCGGNIDCKDLVAGSTLYLPIAVVGALFSVGDGHAAQGDGEVSGMAIECPMERLELTFTLHDDRQLSMPQADTPAGLLTFGFHSRLDEAMFVALEAMLALLSARYNLSRQEALALASAVVDLRITQIVNGIYGAHAVLPHGVLR